MKMNEIRQLTEEELTVKLTNMKEELFHERFRKFTENPHDVTKVRKMRRDVAKLETAVRERAAGINQGMYVDAE